jgi:hypothetical protein
VRFPIRLPFLCLLGVLAVPLAAAADPTAVPLVRTGSLEIALDPDAVSVLPVDSGELRLNLCNGVLQVDGIGTISPRGECDLVVSPPRMGLFVTDATPAGGGSWQVSLHPDRSVPWKGSEPLATSCGLWDVSMVVDPGQTQPVSWLTLEPSAADPGQGVFAGTVKLAVRYRFVNRERGTSIELPAVPSLELTGHWAAVPADGPSLGEGASNLVLFAGSYQGQWESVPTCATWGSMRCEVCVEPGPDVVETLNSDPNLRP